MLFRASAQANPAGNYGMVQVNLAGKHLTPFHLKI